MEDNKTYTVDESFIREAYSEACPKWKNKLHRKFPELFGAELRIGDRLRYVDKEYIFTEEYIVANCDGVSYVLVNLRTGNKFAQPVQLESGRRLTISLLVGEEKAKRFTKIS